MVTFSFLIFQFFYKSSLFEGNLFTGWIFVAVNLNKRSYISYSSGNFIFGLTASMADLQAGSSFKMNQVGSGSPRTSLYDFEFLIGVRDTIDETGETWCFVIKGNRVGLSIVMVEPIMLYLTLCTYLVPMVNQATDIGINRSDINPAPA